MFTSIDTYSPVAIDARLMLVASFARPCDQGWLHADIALAGRSLR
jgi:hypothetical protein